MRPGLYSKIYHNSVSHKAIILHLKNNLIISGLTARAEDRVAGRAEAFLAGQMPCHDAATDDKPIDRRPRRGAFSIVSSEIYADT